MAKRSSNKRVSVVTQVEPTPPMAGVLLRCNYPDILITIGPVTGERYVSSHGGTILTVDAQDVPGMLAKTWGSNSCCGGVGKALPKYSLV